MGSDFNSNEESSTETEKSWSLEECSALGKSTDGCTHFVWVKSKGDTCVLLTGDATKNDDLLSGYKVRCGLIEEISYKKKTKKGKFEEISFSILKLLISNKN